MKQNRHNQQDGVIRISHNEVHSQKVDDLIKRQMSLRGDSGVTKGKRKWYLQAWVVYTIAAVLGALTGWAVLEPFYGETLEIRGTVNEISYNTSTFPEFGNDAMDFLAPEYFRGSITIDDQKVWISHRTALLNKDAYGEPAYLYELEQGQEVVAYVRAFNYNLEIFSFADCLKTGDNLPGKAGFDMQELMKQDFIFNLLFFPIIAAFVGLFLGASDGILCRLPRRAIMAGFFGALIGLVGGFISSIFAEIIYTPLTLFAQEKEGSLSFALQMSGRGIAWSAAGMAMGLGQGIALRSQKLLLYGFLGGIIGGLFGGLFFDPISFIFSDGVNPSGHVSRAIGVAIVGAGIGFMIGLVELLARDSWLRMLKGPLTGKEFLIFKDTMKIGASPKSDIYLFSDNQVAAHHATLRIIGENTELESQSSTHPIIVNDRTIEKTRIRNGDQIQIGQTIFTYECRQ